MSLKISPFIEFDRTQSNDNFHSGAYVTSLQNKLGKNIGADHTTIYPSRKYERERWSYITVYEALNDFLAGLYSNGGSSRTIYAANYYNSSELDLIYFYD